MQALLIKIKEQDFYLHPNKAIFWVQERILLLADLHLGKAKHFRKAGFPVPSDVSNENWDRLLGLILAYKPDRILFLGDLFHSDYNTEWEDLKALIQQFSNISFELVPGNHDILAESDYKNAGLITTPEILPIGPFLMSHHPLEVIPKDQYNLSGHIHPCVFLSGNGRQSLKLPCFYFGKQQGILPAFGAFTGMAKIQAKAEDDIYVIVSDKVMQVR